jgi:outer membrane immunogenic protein
MNKARFAIFGMVALLSIFAVGQAFAEDKSGVYVSVKGGYEYMDHKDSDVTAGGGQNATNKSWSDKNSWTAGGALGYNFAGTGFPVRAEAEYLYHDQFKYSANNSTTGTFSSKINVHTLFANAYYDIKTGTAFTPYVGAGLGVAWIRQKASSSFVGGVIDDDSYNTTNLAWNLGAGIGYALTENVVLDLGYRYTSFGDAKDVQSGSLNFRAKELKSHEALLGVRYQF